MHELPLVFFTVLGQTAAGLFLLAGLSRWIGLSEALQLRQANLLATLLLLLGLSIGALHVGQPLRAFNMLLGVGRSPMSNEILLSAIFAALACTTLFFSRIYPQPTLEKITNWLTVIAGIAFVWSIPQVYRLESVPHWESVHTTLQMWLTMLAGGGALALYCGARQTGGLALLVGVVLILSTQPSYLAFLSHISSALVAQQSPWLTAQAALLVLALAIAIAGWLHPQIRRRWLICSAVGVIAAELAGRVAFYTA